LTKQLHALAIRGDIQDAASLLQVCAGHVAGWKAAIHAVHQVIDSSDTVILLVDALLNWQTAVRSIYQLCHALIKILINTN